jgi:signal transduction histidine kinase
MRVTEELAARHRRTVETASAGMFELLTGLVSAEEGARGQLAAELHDTVAQSLAAARTLLESGQLERALAYLEDAEDQTRATMSRTRPPALRDGDLAAAVSGLCAELNQRYALEVTLSWPAEARPLPIATAVTAYRFIQESLLNVVKHADMDVAQVALAFEGEHLVVAVRDEGAGFNPAAVRSERGRHVGLGLLRERIRLVGGTLEVTSSPGHGTTLTMSLPAAGGRPAGLSEAGLAASGDQAPGDQTPGDQRSAETPATNGGRPAMAAMVATNASRWGARSSEPAEAPELEPAEATSELG